MEKTPLPTHTTPPAPTLTLSPKLSDPETPGGYPQKSNSTNSEEKRNSLCLVKQIALKMQTREESEKISY
jgi:hypothetical protein